MLKEFVAYDLTCMVGQVLEVVNIDSMGMLTDAQRRKVDEVIYEYAERSIKIVSDYID